MYRQVKRAISLLLVIVLLFSLSCEAFAQTLVLPASLREIGDEAFYGDESVDEVVIPEGAESIGERAFADSGVQKIHIPESVTNIADNAFDGAEDATIVSSPRALAKDYAERHDIPWESTEPEPEPEWAGLPDSLPACFGEGGVFARMDAEFIELPDIPELGEEYVAIVQSFNAMQQEQLADTQTYNSALDELDEASARYTNHFSDYSVSENGSVCSLDTGSFVMNVEEDALRLLDGACTAKSAKLVGETLCYTLISDVGEKFYLNLHDHVMDVSRRPAEEPESTAGLLSDAAVFSAGEDGDRVPSAPDRFFDDAEAYITDNLADHLATGRSLVDDIYTLTYDTNTFSVVTDKIILGTEEKVSEIDMHRDWLRAQKKKLSNREAIDLIEQAQRRILRQRSLLKTAQRVAMKSRAAAKNLCELCGDMSPLGDIYSIYTIRTLNEKLCNLKKHGHTDPGDQFPERSSTVRQLRDSIEAALWIGRGDIALSIFTAAASICPLVKGGKLAKYAEKLSAACKSAEKDIALYDLGSIINDPAGRLYEEALEIDETLHYELGGVVIDKETRKELENVTIICQTANHEDMQVMTGSDGMFTVEPLASKVTLTFRAEGYKELQVVFPEGTEELIPDYKLFKAFELEPVYDRILSGVVNDSNTGEALAGAAVTLTTEAGEVYTTYTESAGKYTFYNPPAGAGSLLFEQLFYDPSAPVTVTIPTRGSVTQNISLTYNGNALDGTGFGEDFWRWCIENFDCHDTVEDEWGRPRAFYGPSAWNEWSYYWDGKLDAEEVRRVTEISLENFSSLQGIQIFYNLRELRCSVEAESVDLSANRNLQSIDISGGVKNLVLPRTSALKTLSCSGQLTSLDVSGCSGLERLICNNTQLRSINASGCTSLTVLNCSFSQLTSLNLSGCTALTDLYCSGNQLTSLNLSGCTSLETLECTNNRLTSLKIPHGPALISLNCSNNQLTSLDLSDCTSLQELTCHDNLLNTLDCTGCTSLGKTVAYENNPLERLDFSGCTSLQQVSPSVNTKVLDVSGCTALVWLDYCGTEMTSLDVSGCTSLTHLKCSNNQLTNLNVSGLSALASLDCANNRLTSLSYNGAGSLRDLDCANNQLTSLNISALPALQYLSCSDNYELNNLRVSGHAALNNLFCENCTALEELNCSGCTALTELKCTGSACRVLDCSGCTMLAAIYYNDTALERMDCSGCTALEHFYVISSPKELILSGCTALADLSIGGNQKTALNVSGCTALVELSSYGSALTSLDASGCTALTYLNCENNAVTRLDCSGCTALETLYSANNQMTTLNLTGCAALDNLDCGDNALEALNISDCEALIFLRCSGNPLTRLDVTGCPQLTLDNILCDDGVTILGA